MTTTLPQEIRRLMPLAALCLLSPLVSGCFRHHAIEPGRWRLTIEAKPSSPESKRFLRKPRDVDVQVDWSKADTTMELIKVHYLSRVNQNEIDRALVGTIDTERKVSLEGSDPDWELALWGSVNSLSSMNGLVFGRSRNFKLNDLLFEGTWTMRRIEPQEE
jgi:hypothetical protein